MTRLRPGCNVNSLAIDVRRSDIRIRRTIPHNILSYRLVTADGTDTGYDVIDHVACPPPCPDRRPVCENTFINALKGIDK